MLRTGIDIVEIDRIRAAIQRRGQRFLDRLFTPAEQRYCQQHTVDPAMRYAGRFAAKEAIAKALGTGIGPFVGWLDIEIASLENGEPMVVLSKDLACRYQMPQIALSISHCRAYATAVAIMQRGTP